MAGGSVNLSPNVQISDSISSANTQIKNESVTNNFKDIMKNEADKNNQSVDETTREMKTDETTEGSTENITDDKEKFLNEVVALAQNQIIYSNFIINNDTIISNVNEQSINDETNILPIQQDNILIDVNKTTTQSNVKLLNDTVDVTSDNNVFVDKSATNKGNIVLNSKDVITVENNQEFKNNMTVVENNSTSEKILDNNNTLKDISMNKNVLSNIDNNTNSNIEKNVIVEKKSNNEFVKENNEFIFSDIQPELQTLQKTSQGDVIQFKVSDSKLINADTVVDNLADKIIMRNNNEFDLQLNPKELGKIHINVVFENGETKVSILCTTQQAMDALAGNTDKLAALLENRTGNTTFVQVSNEENQLYNQNYQQQEQDGRNNGRNSDAEKRNKNTKTENSVDFLEQMRLGLI